MGQSGSEKRVLGGAVGQLGWEVGDKRAGDPGKELINLEGFWEGEDLTQFTFHCVAVGNGGVEKDPG